MFFIFCFALYWLSAFNLNYAFVLWFSLCLKDVSINASSLSRKHHRMNINVSTIVNLRQILLIGDHGKSKHERKKNPLNLRILTFLFLKMLLDLGESLGFGKSRYVITPKMK